MPRVSPTACGAIFLTVLYIGFYFVYPARPGHSLYPAGWIGWWDQGRYYDSLRALAAGNLDPAQHWYPLGYAILAVPFVFLGDHPFFVIDLVSLLVAYRAFIAFAIGFDIPPVGAALIFILSNCLDHELFLQWVIPWSTTPAVALIWVLLALAARGRSLFPIGLIAAVLLLIRPTDALVSAIVLAWLLVRRLRDGDLRLREVVYLALGAAIPILPYAALHLAIYGPHPTPYTIQSGRIGLTLHDPVWRAYVLLIEPRQWFFAGQGLFSREPWLVLGIVGIVWGALRSHRSALLSAVLIAYCLLYLAYVDLLPTGLWRFYNVHYFLWTLPGFGLFAWIAILQLWLRDRAAWAGFAAVLLITAIRVTPRPAGPDEAAKAVDFHAVAATQTNTTMNSALAARDASGVIANITQMRAFAFPTGDSVRLIGLKQDFVGPIALEGSTEFPTARWAERIGFGYPCWLPPRPCHKPW